MNSNYQNNIKIIIDRQWEYLLNNISENPIPAIKSKSNLPTFKYNESYIHSYYDPILEAKKLVNIKNNDNRNLIFVVGLGYGYHIKELLAQIGDKSCAIFVLEYSKEIFCSALYFADLSFLSDKRVNLFVKEGLTYSLNLMLSSINAQDVKGSLILYLQSEYNVFKKIYDDILKQVNYLIQNKFQNQLTTLEFNKLWLKNAILNSKNLGTHYDISFLYNKLQNYPALIVSAGPSLSSSIPEINKIKDEVLIFATDTAISTLKEFNIIPDFIVSVDGQFHNYKDYFTFGKKESSVLLYNLFVYHKIPDWIRGKHFYFASYQPDGKEYPIIECLQSAIQSNISKIKSGSSVSSTAIELARLMGCHPIVLVGQDLSYPNLMTHTKSSPIYNYFLFKTNKLISIESLFHKTINARKLFTVTEKPLLKTDFILKNLNEWLGDYASVYQKIEKEKLPLLLNATETDFPIRNIPNITLTNVFKNILFEKSFQKSNAKLLMHIINVPIINSIYSSKLSSYYKNILIELNIFFNLLINKLDSKKIDEKEIQVVKKKLVLNYPFLEQFYQKEDFWYYRKVTIQDFDRCLYLNTLLKATEFIIKTLNKALKKINNT